jgi:hypothetical protein
MKSFLGAILSCCLLPALSELRSDDMNPASGNVDWIGGYWLSCRDGAQTAEAWIGSGSGVLVGVTHGTESGAVTFEYMRIAPGTNGRLSFFGSPGGAPAVEFPSKRIGEQQALFENPAHDFPQRVEYSRAGDELIGRIEGTIDGKTERIEWRYRAAAFPSKCENAA